MASRTLDDMGDLIDSGYFHDARATLGDDFDITGLAVNWASQTGPTLPVGEALMMPLFLPNNMEGPRDVGDLGTCACHRM
jgi:hypothetical protein